MWRLLESIIGIGNGCSLAMNSCKGKEQFHTGLLNAGSICLSKIMEPGSSTLRTIKTSTRFITTINFDTIGPMNSENVGWAACNRSRMRQVFAKSLGIKMIIEVDIIGSIPFRPI